MQDAGVNVKLAEDSMEHFAVMDQELVWHGGMNLLGKEDVWDNLIRVKDTKAASELLELVIEQSGRDTNESMYRRHRG